MAAPLTSAEAAELYGVSRDTLAYYEQEGIVSPLGVGWERYYRPADLIRIQIAMKGERLGFSAKEIKSLIDAHLPPPRELRSSTEIVERIDQLEDEKNEIQAAIDRLAGKIGKKPDEL